MKRPVWLITPALFGLEAGLAFINPWLAAAAALPLSIACVALQRHLMATAAGSSGREEELEPAAHRHAGPATAQARTSAEAPASAFWSPDAASSREAPFARPAASPLSASSADDPQTAALRAALATYVPALPVLAAQLQDAVQSSERAVEQICTSFQEIAERARKSVELAAHQATGEGGGQLESLMRAAQGTLHELTRELSRDSAQSQKALERIRALQEGMLSTLRIARDVETFTNHVKLMSVNARLEASRLGEEGRAFGVIAGEITELAKHGAQMVGTIQEIVNRLTGDSTATCKELEQLAAQAHRNQQDVSRALEVLGTGYQQMHRSVLLASENGNALARDVSSAVVALQFQDATSQRISHVVRALNEMETGLSNWMEGGDSSGASREQEGTSLLAQMQQHYTMHAERQLLARLTGGESSEAGSLGDNVELF